MLRAGLIGCWLAVSLSTFAQTPGKVDFARDVEPLFQKRCYMCHGPQQQMSGLRFDQKESAGARHPAGEERVEPPDPDGQRDPRRK